MPESRSNDESLALCLTMRSSVISLRQFIRPESDLQLASLSLCTLLLFSLTASPSIKDEDLSVSPPAAASMAVPVSMAAMAAMSMSRPHMAYFDSDAMCTSGAADASIMSLMDMHLGCSQVTPTSMAGHGTVDTILLSGGPSHGLHLANPGAFMVHPPPQMRPSPDCAAVENETVMVEAGLGDEQPRMAAAAADADQSPKYISL